MTEKTKTERGIRHAWVWLNAPKDDAYIPIEGSDGSITCEGCPAYIPGDVYTKLLIAARDTMTTDAAIEEFLDSLELISLKYEGIKRPRKRHAAKTK